MMGSRCSRSFCRSCRSRKSRRRPLAEPLLRSWPSHLSRLRRSTLDRGAPDVGSSGPRRRVCGHRRGVRRLGSSRTASIRPFVCGTRQALANSDIDDADRLRRSSPTRAPSTRPTRGPVNDLIPVSARSIRSRCCITDGSSPAGEEDLEAGNQFSRTAPGRVIQILGSEALAAAAVSLAGAAADPWAEALGGAAVGSAAASAAVAVSAEAAAAAAGSPKRIINRRLGTCCDGSRYQPQRPGGDRHGRFIGHGKGLCHTARRGGCRCSDRCRASDRVDRTVEDILVVGGRAIAAVGDVSTSAYAEAAVATTLGEFGRLDILVNGAGINHRATAEDTTDEDWRRVMATNVRRLVLHVSGRHIPAP